MPLEEFFRLLLVTPGLVAGRLSVEPWLALVGIAIGVRSGSAWFAATVAALLGAIWGMLSFALGAPAGPLIEWAYMAMLPVLVTAMLAYAVKRGIRPQTARPAE